MYITDGNINYRPAQVIRGTGMIFEGTGDYGFFVLFSSHTAPCAHCLSILCSAKGKKAISSSRRDEDRTAVID